MSNGKEYKGPPPPAVRQTWPPQGNGSYPSANQSEETMLREELATPPSEPPSLSIVGNVTQTFHPTFLQHMKPGDLFEQEGDVFMLVQIEGTFKPVVSMFASGDAKRRVYHCVRLKDGLLGFLDAAMLITPLEGNLAVRARVEMAK